MGAAYICSFHSLIMHSRRGRATVTQAAGRAWQRWRAAPPQLFAAMKGEWLLGTARQAGASSGPNCSAGQLPDATDADRRRMNESLSVLHDLTSRWAALPCMQSCSWGLQGSGMRA